MSRTIACVAISSAMRALSMMLSQIAFPSSKAFWAAFSMPPVMVLIPLITWSRLIFLLIPFMLWASLSAPAAACTVESPSPFSAASVSSIPVRVFSSAAFSF